MCMGALIVSEVPPLVEDADGVLRVSGTRVTLDTVVTAFQEGATAEEIVDQYPSITLANVYQVIGFYLRHSDELDIYLEQRGLAAEQTRTLNESRWPAEGIRARLMARRHS